MADFATLVLGAETAGLKKAEPALDAVIAKAGKADAAVKKMGAATRQMGTDAQAGATQAKAALDGIEVEAKAAEASLRQAATGLDSMQRAAVGAGQASGAAAGQVGNLTAQVFDISMMLQAGQNPFALMLQQGSQVAQVLGPMGATGALQAFKGVFAQLVSPVNLLTMGVIGLTAAIVPMVASLFDGAEAAEAQKKAMEAEQAVIDGLIAKIEELTIARQMLQSGASSAEEQAGLNEINALVAERVALEAELANQVRFVGTAQGANQRAELAARQEAVQARIAEIDAMIQTINKEEERIQAIERAKAIAELFQTVMDEAARTDLNSPWNRVLGAIQNAINKANIYRATIANAQAAFDRGNKVYGGRGGDPRQFDGSGPQVFNPSADVVKAADAMLNPSSGGGGGGGGGGRSESAAAAEKEAEAIQKVVDKLKSEIEQVGMNDEARRLHQELQRAGVDIYSKEGQEIAALVEKLTELEAKQKLVSETMRGIESAAQGFFVGVLSGAKDLESAIGDLLRQLGNLFLNQAFKMLWEGTGGGGGLGGFIAGLFDAGGHIPAGQVGVVAEKRPELVNGKLVTRPTLVSGPADVTGGAATAKMMGVPMPQTASPRRASMQMAAAPRVTVTPPPVVVLDDPRKIDAWQRSPEGERTAAWQRRRMGNG
jgi:hypothetical protein